MNDMEDMNENADILDNDGDGVLEDEDMLINMDTNDHMDDQNYAYNEDGADYYWTSISKKYYVMLNFSNYNICN